MDKDNLRQIIIDYPNQLNIGQKFANKTTLDFKKKEYDNIIICGMGGSALPAELLINYLEKEKLKLNIFISRNYDLPLNASKNSLIFISSYSGNTEETISCFNQALELKADIVSFSEGGEVEKIAKINNIPHVKYNIKFDHIEPRYATTYVFTAMHQVLTNLNITDTIEDFPNINSRDFEVYGEEIAKKIKNKIPVIYASNKHKSLARIWKIKINENSKSPAFWNYFPELNHNELVGFSNPRDNYFVLMLIDENDQERIKKRIRITSDLYKKLGIKTEIIDIKGENYLSKILNTLVLGDWISYYLAIEYNQDPTPVKLVE
ncbi:MAG: bifunctional phosphoglucose/phosphomannose isomerase [Patescibacteria group bacterium]|jgi:glucose/mannose-6-phosphate isomerase|nr:bifunctional phosphoglucose/phosphomannose isomerase [Patescibacteria group bacterium]